MPWFQSDSTNQQTLPLYELRAQPPNSEDSRVQIRLVCFKMTCGFNGIKVNGNLGRPALILIKLAVLALTSWHHHSILLQVVLGTSYLNSILRFPPDWASGNALKRAYKEV